MDYKEISRLGGDPGLVRATAAGIKRLLGSRMTDGQDEFLSKLETFEGPDRLSIRQCEFLISLRDRATRRSKVQGYTAYALISRLHELRYDLSEEDEIAVVRFFNEGPSIALTNPEWRYIFALCRQLDLLDHGYIELN